MSVGMDHRFPVSRDELYTLQMDFKQIQLVQNNQAERLSRLERRQEQDANLKSVWQQHPFPGVLAGTPQQGPTQVNSSDLYDMDEPDHLLSSLHLEPAEEEPARRGAASRANSVRFDESALRQSDWTSHSNRHSGEFGPPTRPGSGLMMERSLSHKSDGRHSSAGHSVHSLHSLASGRASSLGMHTDNFMVDSHDDESPLDGPEPPPEFFVLGSVPTIIRCWLSTQFAHHTILYADLCTGSQRSTLDYTVVKELDLIDHVQRDMDGSCRLRLPVYLVEATVAERSHRSSSPGHPQIPSITATFEIVGMDQTEAVDVEKGIRVFIGSDALRAHMADVLLSQNRMSLMGNEREKLSVPFVRPEDESSFKHICTANVVPERPRLNATAAVFISGEAVPSAATSTQEMADEAATTGSPKGDGTAQGLASPTGDGAALVKTAGPATVATEFADKNQLPGKEVTANEAEASGKELSSATSAAGSVDSNRRESSGGIWGSWRHATAGNGGEGGARDSGPLSGYQPAGRGGRNMKVLKPLKSGSGPSSSARTGAAYEPAPPPRTSGEQQQKQQQPQRRKSQANPAAGSDSGSSAGIRWESKRAVSSGAAVPPLRDARSSMSSAGASGGAGSASASGAPAPPLPRSANPVGGASAFSWMNPAGKSKPAPTATAE